MFSNPRLKVSELKNVLIPTKDAVYMLCVCVIAVTQSLYDLQQCCV